MSSIELFNQTPSRLPISTDILSDIIVAIQKEEQCLFEMVETVIVTPERIVEINKEYLERDYVTDVISFRYDDQANLQNLEGTLFCCWKRIQEQAREFDESPQRELLRVIIHGILHLTGYEDQSSPQKQKMREKEDHYLSKIDG